MKQFARTVLAIPCLSVASLSLMALAGCGAAGSGAPGGAKNIYAIQTTANASTETYQSSVQVFSASSTGSTTPTSTLTLPSDVVAISVAVGPQGQIYVGAIQLTGDTEVGQILEYPAGSSGSATPSVTLTGGSTGTFILPIYLAVNSADTLFVSSIDGSLEAFASGFTSSSAPSQYLTWGMQPNSATGDSNFDNGYATGIGVDTAGELFCTDLGSGVIDVFAAGATGATAPARTITGTNTSSFGELAYMAVDGAGDVYVANYNAGDDTFAGNGQTMPVTNGLSQRMQAMRPRGASRSEISPLPPEVAPPEPTEIIEFAAGANGTPTPLKRIGGAATNIVEPDGLALDAASNLYYADANGALYTGASTPVLLEVFSASATGNVAPTASMTSAGFTYLSLSAPSPLNLVAVY
jgi:hypothetical protein